MGRLGQGRPQFLALVQENTMQVRGVGGSREWRERGGRKKYKKGEGGGLSIEYSSLPVIGGGKAQ